jgi:hypothetical protein
MRAKKLSDRLKEAYASYDNGDTHALPTFGIVHIIEVTALEDRLATAEKERDACEAAINSLRAAEDAARIEELIWCRRFATDFGDDDILQRINELKGEQNATE